MTRFRMLLFQRFPRFSPPIVPGSSHNYPVQNNRLWYIAEIGKEYGVCRGILMDVIREGTGDGTIRADLNPFLTSMYRMISFMGILSQNR